MRNFAILRSGFVDSAERGECLRSKKLSRDGIAEPWLFEQLQRFGIPLCANQRLHQLFGKRRPLRIIRRLCQRSLQWSNGGFGDAVSQRSKRDFQRLTLCARERTDGADKSQDECQLHPFNRVCR